MNFDFQQFADQIQSQWQAAQGPLQDLWTNSQYLSIGAATVLGGLLLLMFLGLVRGGFKRRSLARKLAANDENIKQLRQENATERYKESQERAKLRKELAQQLTDAQNAAAEEIQSIRDQAAESDRQAQAQLADTTAKSEAAIKAANDKAKSDLANAKKAAEDALLTEREHHRTEVNRLKADHSTTQEALRQAQANTGTSARIREQLEQLTAANAQLEADLAKERTTSQSLRNSAGSGNAELIRERERLQAQLEAALAQPLSGNFGPQLESVEACLNSAIEAFATRNIDGAVTALSNAAQIVGELKRAENAAV